MFILIRNWGPSLLPRWQWSLRGCCACRRGLHVTLGLPENSMKFHNLIFLLGLRLGFRPQWLLTKMVKFSFTSYIHESEHENNKLPKTEILGELLVVINQSSISFFLNSHPFWRWVHYPQPCLPNLNAIDLCSLYLPQFFLVSGRFVPSWDPGVTLRIMEVNNINIYMK